MHRPAIAVPIPVFGAGRPQLLVDGGATVDCPPEWLVEWAVLGREYARIRLGVDEPTRRRCSRTARSRARATRCARPRAPLLARREGFVGNVEGRDFMHGTADVIVTDGFTGNVALKTVEGRGPRASPGWCSACSTNPELRRRGRRVEAAHARSGRRRSLPDNTGGALLLGVDGVCVISHGSSSATAIVNAGAVRAGACECVEAARRRTRSQARRVADAG